MVDSNSIYRGLYVLSEGPIEGPANGTLPKSVYFNGVPLQDSSGNLNFHGAAIAYRQGLPSQSHITGFESSSSTVSVNTQVIYGTPQSFAVAGSFDAVNVTLSWPNGYYLTNSSGETKTRERWFTISVQSYGSSTWVQVYQKRGGREKQMAGFDETYRIPLPAGGSPWTIQVTKDFGVDDVSGNHITTEMYIKRYETVVDGKFTYPNLALLGVEVDAKHFLNEIPLVAAKMKGIQVWVPQNYDPVARTYATTGAGTSGGTWDGTFKLAYTNNPVWCYYDMIINNRYGLGLEMNINNDPTNALADKWNLYVISQYCDGMVDDGYGGTEPRFTLNALINTRQEAYNLIQQLVSTFRGMVYYASDQLFVAADIPGSVQAVFTQADVENGLFNYTGTPLKSRSSVVYVNWKNPQNQFNSETEVVEDFDAIYAFGYRQKIIQGFGITSRGLARRLAKWMLLSEKYQTQTLTFKTDARGGKLFPGSLIKIMDPYKAGVRQGGKLLGVSVGASTTTFTLDSSVTLVAGHTYSITVVLPDLTLGTYTVTTGAGTSSTLDIGSALSTAPIVGATWILTSDILDGQLYRVVAVKETSTSKYDVLAIEHYANKYAEVEQGPAFSTAPTSIYTTNQLAAPTGLTEVEWWYEQPGAQSAPRISVSWTPVDDNRVQEYELQLRTSTDYTTVYKGPKTSWDSGNITPSDSDACNVRVRAVGNGPTYSAWTISPDFYVVGKNTVANPPSGLVVTPSMDGFELSWTNSGDADFAYVEVWESADNIQANASLLGISSGTTYTISGYAPAVTKYYWIRSITHALQNYQSSYVGPVSGTTTGVGTSNFDANTIGIPVVSTLPSLTGYTGPAIVYLTTDGKLYTIRSGAWSPLIATVDSSSIGVPAFASPPSTAGYPDGQFYYNTTDGRLYRLDTGTNSWVGIDAGIPTGSSNPVSGVEGDLFFNTTDGKLYRYHSGAWISSYSASDISGSISDSQIASLAATKVTGQITNTQITDGAISTAKLASGSVTAGTLAAGAVTASKLTLTATSLIADTFIEDTNSWVVVEGSSGSNQALGAWSWYIATPSVANTNLSVRSAAVLDSTVGGFTNTTSQYLYLGDGTTALMAPVKASTTYEWRVSVKNASNHVLTWGVQWCNSSGTFLSSTTGTVATSTTSNVIQKITSPANAAYARIEFYNGNGNTGNAALSGQIYVSAVSLREANAATMIVDGSITGTQIAASTITGTKIAAGTISGGNIGANTITSGNIASNTITAGQIAANTITASQIAANTITASQIASNTITSSQIAANTITAGQIQAGTITSNEIHASTITTNNIIGGAVTGATAGYQSVNTTINSTGVFIPGFSYTTTVGSSTHLVQAQFYINPIYTSLFNVNIYLYIDGTYTGYTALQKMNDSYASSAMIFVCVFPAAGSHSYAFAGQTNIAGSTATIVDYRYAVTEYKR